MRSIVRFVSLVGGSVVLSACGAQGRVAFDAGASQPKPVAESTAPAVKSTPAATPTLAETPKTLAAVEVSTLPPDVTVAAQMPTETVSSTPAVDPALRLAINEYRSTVTASMTHIWQHVVPNVEQCATFVEILDRLLASNAALRERDDLADADRAMLDESKQVIDAERFKLIAKWTASSRSVLPN